MTQTETYRVQRQLTSTELTSIVAAINAARTIPEILDAAISAVFSALLEPLGESLTDYGPSRRLDPGTFAIPATQWDRDQRSGHGQG